MHLLVIFLPFLYTCVISSMFTFALQWKLVLQQTKENPSCCVYYNCTSTLTSFVGFCEAESDVVGNTLLVVIPSPSPET